LKSPAKMVSVYCGVSRKRFI